MPNIRLCTSSPRHSPTAFEPQNQNYWEAFRTRPLSGPNHKSNKSESLHLFFFSFFFFFFFSRGKRERSPPLPQIMQSSFPHLGKSQGSAHPECNGCICFLGFFFLFFFFKFLRKKQRMGKRTEPILTITTTATENTG